ncbi:hypothetical protein [Campylobacter sp. P0085]|uniref:hypothetical protein n=1 Tax=Campylobacter sp. P0085 TaxID=1895597 RepID=UPI000A34A40F|nr:hypothetical protein [Campylobacter sp. P0085]
MTQAQIEKLNQKSERQLKAMLDNIEKNEIKLEAEQTRLKNKLQKEIKKKIIIKKLLTKKWNMEESELENVAE